MALNTLMRTLLRIVLAGRRLVLSASDLQFVFDDGILDKDALQRFFALLIASRFRTAASGCCHAGSRKRTTMTFSALCNQWLVVNQCRLAAVRSRVATTALLANEYA